MAELLFSNKAIEDLSSIWNYTYDEWSELQADHYYEVLISSCQLLLKSPDSGRKYDWISEGLKGYKAQKHLIFYLVEANQDVKVIRILHEQMDLKSRLEED